MKTKIYRGTYKSEECMVLENERLLVKILPQVGSKIQSIYDKNSNKEYLYQSSLYEFKKAQYDSDYGKGQFDGFDEMFPGISKCFYPLEPWEGVKIPDHGEVWALPWKYEVNETSIQMKTNGVRFPYTLMKSVEFLKENTIQINYKVTNNSHFDFYYSWAAHPLFNCNENFQIILPPTVTQVINSVPSKRMGGFGEIHSWPITVTPDGTPYNMSEISPESSELYEKYYVCGKEKQGWSALRDIKTNESIVLSYPASKVPYLGIWVNEGGYANQYNVALEPCTGTLDRLDTAIQWNQVSSVKAYCTEEWFLNITFDKVEYITGVDLQGNIY